MTTNKLTATSEQRVDESNSAILTIEPTPRELCACRRIDGSRRTLFQAALRYFVREWSGDVPERFGLSEEVVNRAHSADCGVNRSPRLVSQLR